MTDEAFQLAVLVVVIAGVLIASLMIKALCRWIRVPPLAGYLLLGFLLAALNSRFPLLGDYGHAVFEFLGTVGVIALLVMVGLQSNLKRLLGQLKRASPLWLLSVVIAAAAGYLATRYLLGYPVVPSVVVAVAMTATSVGVPSAVWEEEHAIDTDDGQLFIDVAELDDISGIILMAMLFTVLPALRSTAVDASEFHLADLPVATMLATGGVLLLKLAGLGVGCFLFARFVEGPLMRLFEGIERKPDVSISTSAIAALIAGLTGLLGFSVAIGGFFAGLAFSRRAEMGNDRILRTLFDISVPFFFISVGLKMDPSGIGTGLGTVGILFVAAFFGKLIGTMAPAIPILGASGGLLLGISMVPRGEITMIIASRGLAHGEWAMPQPLYNAVIAMSLLTCLVAPIGMRLLIRRRFGRGAR